MSRFPVAFRPPAFASPVIRFPLGHRPSSRSAYRARRRARTPSGLPRSAPSSCDRGGCPLDPGDGGALPAGCRARPAPAASQRPVPAPRDHIPPARLRFTRHQRGFTRFTRPVCPSPVTPGWDGRPWASPWASHPAVTSDARQGWGRAVSTHPELRCRHHIGPPIREFPRKVRPRVATAEVDVLASGPGTGSSPVRGSAGDPGQGRLGRRRGGDRPRVDRWLTCRLRCRPSEGRRPWPRTRRGRPAK